MNGYHGCYLRIDLAGGSSRRVALDEGALRRFLGGVGLGAWLLHREAPPGVAPLAPEAPLVFAFSPLVGSPLTTSAKFAVLAKSPLTSRINDALSSSHFALAGKRTGADALVITDACSSPSVLVIEEGAIRLDPAEGLWGLPAEAATEELARRYGGARSIWPAAVIGPAGENRVRFATISHGNRHAGRGGLGAVMGAKNLKAVVVAGSRRVPLADPEGVVAAARDLSRRSFGPATAKYRELGTVSNLLAFNRLHALPTRNFREGHFPEAEGLSVEAAGEGLQRVARASCAACTIGCEHLFALGPGEGSVRLEYESLFALGPLCGVGERDVVLRAARLCDSLGLDTISAGATIAFAMECGERGLLPDEGLRFGNGEMLLSLLGRIARREGPLGDLLAEGTRRAAECIGGEAPDFAPHVKGLEVPGYEPRTLQTMALGFAVGSRGADHNRSGAYEVDFSAKGGIGSDRHGSAANAAPAVETEDRAALMDSLILCKFLRGVFADFWGESAELLRLVTGWDVDEAELRQAARRIVTAKKLYNVREGWTRAEDTLPPRFLRDGLGREEQGRNGHRLTRESLDAMIAAYYAARGWTGDGQVPAEVVAGLGLGDL